jgi:hypothetical protein
MAAGIPAIALVVPVPAIRTPIARVIATLAVVMATAPGIKFLTPATLTSASPEHFVGKGDSHLPDDCHLPIQTNSPDSSLERAPFDIVSRFVTWHSCRNSGETYPAKNMSRYKI